MTLSPHFTLAELTVTKSSAPNVPGPAEIAALTALCVAVLEPLRAHYGAAVSIHSGYRSPEVNAATFGSSKTSQHMRGEAADLHVVGVDCGDVARWIKGSGLPFDQVIAETRHGSGPFTWVHVSHRADGKNRGQALQTFDGAHYSPLG